MLIGIDPDERSVVERYQCVMSRRKVGDYSTVGETFNE